MKNYNYSDIDINFILQENGDLKISTELEAIKNSLRNIMSTLKGERRMLPEFALNLWYLLYEPIDETTALEIGQNVLGAIVDWDNRIEITDLQIEPIYDKNCYEIVIVFTVKQTGESDILTTILKKQ